MPKSTVEEESQFRLDADTPYPAKLVEVGEKHREGVSPRTGEEYSFTRWVWKFEVTADTSDFGTWAWGETEDKITTHPGNRARQWAETLRGRPFEIGEGLDTDDLLGLACVITVKNETYTKRDGTTGYSSPIEDVFPADQVDTDPAEPPF